jgi:hypothetical protein
MSKADDAITTSAKPTPTRRSVLSGGVRIAGAAIAGMAAIPSVQALAAIPAQTLPVSENAHKNLAEVRRLVAALIRIDGRIGEADEAHDDVRLEKLEGKHRRIYRKLCKLQTAIESEPPRCWVDFVTRAELVGYEVLHGKPRTDWDSLRAGLETEYYPYERAKVGLALAVLWLADRSASEQPDVRVA